MTDRDPQTVARGLTRAQRFWVMQEVPYKGWSHEPFRSRLTWDSLERLAA